MQNDEPDFVLRLLQDNAYVLIVSHLHVRCMTSQQKFLGILRSKMLYLGLD